MSDYLTDTATVTWDESTPNQVKGNVPDNAITYAKMQNVSAASRLLGRGSAAGSGDPEEITLGTGLSMSGTTLTATGDVLGPASSTDNAIARFDLATGKVLQNSGVLISDANAVTPASNDGGALGTTALAWSDVFFASGAVLNFNSGNYTVTHSPGTLTFSGAVAVGGNLSLTGTLTQLSYTDFAEIAAPSNPSANIARLYAKDDGAGVTRMYFKNSAGTETVVGGRIALIADTTYNVGSAQTYTTPQALYEYIRDNVDTAGYDVIAQLTDASLTTTSDIDGPLTGGGRFRILGDTTTPNNRILTTSTAEYTLEILNGATVYIEGVGFTHTGGSGAACFVRHGSTLVINGNCEFGGGAGTIDITLQNDSSLIRAASYRISGTRTRHISGSSNSNLSSINNITTTNVSTPVWSEAFAYAHASARLCFQSGETFSGSATGPRFLLEQGGHIFTGGAGLSFLPGSTAGTLDGSSSYDGILGSLIASGNVTYALPAGPTGTIAQFASADSTNTVAIVDAFAATPVVGGRRAQGTAASPSTLNAANLPIVVFGAYGRDDVGYSSGAQADVSMFSNEAWTSSARGTHLRLRATPNGSTTLTEILRITGTGTLWALDGSASAPSAAFSTQTNTGVYYSSNTFNIATQGVLRASVSSAGLVLSVPLAPASGGTGVASAAQYLAASATLDMNVTTDQALTISLPSGYTRYKINQILVYEPSISLTTAAGGIYTASAKGGVQVVASSQTYSGLTTTGPDTLGSAFVIPGTNYNTIFLADTTLFFSLTTPQGAAATAKIVLYVMPVP